MKNKKLIQLIIKLGTVENGLRDFSKYIRSPYITQSKRLVALFEYLRRYHEDFNDYNLDKTRIFKAVFPSSTRFDDVLLRRLFSQLAKMVEDFFVQTELAQDPFQYYIYLAKSFKKHKLDKPYKALMAKIDKVLPEEEAEQYLAQALINYDLYFDPKSNLDQEKQSQHYLDEFGANLDANYAILKLKYCCEKLVRNLFFGESLADDFDQKLKELLAYLPNKEIPIIKLFSMAASFLSYPSYQGFKILKQTFVLQMDSLRSEKKALLLYLLNGLPFIEFPESSGPEYFELYKLGVEKELFIENGSFSPTTFNNIVHVSCQLEEFDWVENFIANNIQYLDSEGDMLESISTLYSCYLHFGRGEYQIVLDKFKDMRQYEDFTYGLRRYKLELKSIFEQLQHDGLPDIADRSNSFKAYLRRKNKGKYISDAIKQRNENFIFLLQKIAEFPFSKCTKEELKADLDKTNGQVVEKSWLLEKINAL